MNDFKKIYRFTYRSISNSCKHNLIRRYDFFLIHDKDLVRTINDPEHPLTLEELSVVQESLVKVDDENNKVHINFTPTIPHCSMATLIGLAIRVKLLRSLPERFKVDVEITPGSHASELAGINVKYTEIANQVKLPEIEDFMPYNT